MENILTKKYKFFPVVFLVKRLALILLLFFYVYDTNFVFIPSTTRNLICVFGIVFFTIYIFIKKIFIEKEILLSLMLLLLIFIISLFSIILNFTFDASFLVIELIKQIILPCFGAMIIAFFSKKLKLSLQDCLFNIVLVTTFQCIITLSSFFYNPFEVFLRSMQVENKRITNILDAGIRAFGLGGGFDYGSFILSYSMLIICYFYISSNKTKANYLFLFYLHVITGFFVARSIIVGFVFCLFYLFFFNREKQKKIFFLFFSCIFFLLIFLIINILIPDFMKLFSTTLDWALEFFDKNSDKNNSMNVLFGDMYFMPEKFKTWLIGDGLFLSNTGKIYGGTDSLYMKYLLFFGIPGLIMFLIFDYFLIKNLLKKQKKENKKMYILFISFLLLNFVIYIKLNFHFLYLIYYLLWIKYFFYSHRRLEVAKC